MRVLVTGSRSWTDGGAVRRALVDCLDTAVSLATDLTVVHGDASRGVDAIARSWAKNYGAGVVNESHPANWTGACRPTCKPGHRRIAPGHTRDICPAAGQYRNADMVALDAEMCIAFIAACTDPKCLRQAPHGSHGASNCAGLAERAGIRTARITAWRA